MLECQVDTCYSGRQWFLCETQHDDNTNEKREEEKKAVQDGEEVSPVIESSAL